MHERLTLRSHLDRFASQTPHGAAVGKVIEVIAAAGIELAALIADGPLAGITGRVDGVNSDGDQQKDIDVAADNIMRSALKRAPVAAVLSEEVALPEHSIPRRRFAWRSSARWIGQPREQHFGRHHLFDSSEGQRHLSTFFEPGIAQCAAGFVVYGPQTSLVLAHNNTVDIFLLDQRRREFVLIKNDVRIAPRYAGIRHQCIQSPALARSGSRLHRRMPRREHRRPRRRFQHAVDRFAGGGGLAHPGAWRGVSLPRRRASRLSRGAGFGCSTKPIPWR